MSITLAPLPAIPHPGFDALLAELPEAVVPAFRAAEPTLGTLLQSAPYLLDLSRTHAEWLADALERGPDAAFADLIAAVAEAGTTSDEAGLGQALQQLERGVEIRVATTEVGDEPGPALGP